MDFRAALSRFWSARSGRERSVLAAGGTAVAVLALYGFLWEPGLEARRALSTSLPKLRAQVEDMRLQQKEIATLRKTLVVSAQGAELAPLLRASAEQRSLARSIERIEPRPGGKVLVMAGAMRFDEWLDWLRALHEEFGIRLDSCRVDALAQQGLVRVEATFAPGARPAMKGAP